MKLAVLILAFAALAANAADSTKATTREEHRTRMEQAITARDYDAWKAERDAWGAKGQAAQKVTKENFATFAKLHEAVKAGRTEEAAVLRQQLGLGQGGNGGNGMGQGKAGRHGQGNGNGQGAGRGHGGMGGQGCQRNR